MKLVRLILGVLLLVAGISAHALEMPARPTGFVNDLAGLMSPDESRALNAKLGTFRDASRVSIVIATISSASDYGYSGLAEMGTSLFERWAPGEKGLNSGLLIIVAGKAPPYKVRIVTGRGVEGAVPDLVAKRIIEDTMKPAMHTSTVGAVALGLNRGVDKLMERTKTEFAPKSDTASPTASGSDTSVFVLLVVAIGICAVLFLYLLHKSNAKQQARQLREQEERDALARLRASREMDYYATTRQPTTYRERPSRTPTRSQVPSRATSRRREDSDDIPSVVVVTRSHDTNTSYTRSPDPDPTPDFGGETAAGGAGDD